MAQRLPPVRRIDPDGDRHDPADSRRCRAIAARRVSPRMGDDAEPPVTLRLPVESTEVAVAELIRLGADVEILEPKSAREQMVSLVARMAAVYLD